MAEEHVEFRFTCPFCGGSVLELPEGYTDSSMATCGGCGSDIASWGQIKAQAAKLDVEEEPERPKGGTPFKGFR